MIYDGVTFEVSRENGRYDAFISTDGYYQSSRGNTLGDIASTLVIALRNFPEDKVLEEVSFEEIKESFAQALEDKDKRDKFLEVLVRRGELFSDLLADAEEENIEYIAEEYPEVAEEVDDLYDSLYSPKDIYPEVENRLGEQAFKETASRVREAKSIGQVAEIINEFADLYGETMREVVNEEVGRRFDEALSQALEIKRKREKKTRNNDIDLER